MSAKKGLIIFCVLPLALIAATLITYSSSFDNGYVWDDRNFIVQSPFVHDLSHVREICTHNIGYSGGARNNFYRPLYSLLNMFNYVTGGGRPFAFHVTNALLHAICSVLVFFLILTLLSNIPVAFSTAFLFALHPVQTQAVTYIAGRADPMYSVFTLLSLILFLKAEESRRKAVLYAASLVSFVFALLSKEIALVTPFLMLLCVYAFYGGMKAALSRKIRPVIPYFAAAGAYVLLRLTVLDFSKTAYSSLALPTDPFKVRALTACKAVFMYFRFLLFPAGFQMEVHLPKSGSVGEGVTFLAVAGVILIMVLLAYLYGRRKPQFFGLAWFFIALLPVLNLYPVNAVMAVHWLYLPSVGFFFLLSVSLWEALQKAAPKRGKHVFTLVILLVGCVLGVLTYNKNTEWKDEETLYKAILPLSQTPRVYVNLGNIYAREGEFDKAVSCYLRAVQIAPGQTEAYVNLGYIYSKEREYKKAEDVLKKAVRMSPRHTNAHFNLAVVYANTGRYKEALSELDETVKLDPNHISAFNAMGKLYLRTGQRDKAREAFERSLEIDPGQPGVKAMLDKIR